MSTHLVKYDGNNSKMERATKSEIIDVETLPTKAGNSTNLNHLARTRSTLILIVILWAVVAFAPWPDALKGFMDYAFWGLHIFGVLIVCDLASSMQKKAWPFALLSFVGLLNLLVYGYLISEAKKVLNEHNSN
jgi:peptidoglycan/LPS O-acetylase OafA/YrhL